MQKFSDISLSNNYQHVLFGNLFSGDTFKIAALRMRIVIIGVPAVIGSRPARRLREE